MISILGILSSIALPRLSGFLEKTRIKADEASLSTLNKATSLYSISKDIKDEDIFADIDQDQARMEILIENGLIHEKMIAQQKERKFTWNKEKQVWGISLPAKTDEEIAAEEIARKNAEEIEKAIALGFMKEGETSFSGTIGPGYKGEADLIIPSSIAGVDVIAIADKAFLGEGLTSVKIPDTVKSIGKSAFYGNGLNNSFGRTILQITGPGRWKLATITGPPGTQWRKQKE